DLLDHAFLAAHAEGFEAVAEALAANDQSPAAVARDCDLPLERLYRDSRCGALMLPWTAELILDRMGRETLYESGERDE
ncbi:hypothetical protein, partial [Pseudomonas sp. GW460-13]|uniref:hypothetical protein n=1 Tax=Pseudomonas sp. GW460-13 TaxID=2070590 RepID=UPI001C44CB5B